MGKIVIGKVLGLSTNWILVGVIAIGGLAALIGAASQAIWTDTDAIGPNDFATGSVSLTTDKVDTIWTDETAAAPGTIATGQLTVTNGGSLELRYAVTGGNTDAALAAGMNLRIGLEGPDGLTVCEFPYHNADGTLVTLSDDTQLFAGLLNVAALIGNTNPGNDSGDRTLTIASPTEELCFSVVLPDNAANSLQSLTNITTFTFESEQTLNNP